MYKQKSVKFVAVLLTLSLLLTAFSGSAIQAQAETLGFSGITIDATANSTLTEFYFRHFYDAETFNLHRHYIVSAVAFVDQVYSAEFSATFPSTGAISEDTVTDISDCTMDEETPCLSAYCGPNSTHHKDIENISGRLLNWKNQNITGESVRDNYIVTLWADREYGTYCQYYWSDWDGAYFHEYVNALACVIGYRPVIHVLNIADTSTTQRIPHMSLLLAHELAHCFAAEDKYGEERHAEHKADGSWGCIVDCFYADNDASVDFYESIINGTAEPFCELCKNAIGNGLYYWPNVG